LVTYLANYTRVNEFGFLEAPYRKGKKTTKNGQTVMKVTNEVVYLPPTMKWNITLPTPKWPSTKMVHQDQNGSPVRYQGEFIRIPVEQVEYIDVVSRQVVGTAASLIPFISHDEANRALMGTHMQCQAVPLVKPSAPIMSAPVWKAAVAEAMNHVVRARHDGSVNTPMPTKSSLKSTIPNQKK
jgi:DNA-directed RNA polymerase subunit beta